MFRGSLFLKSYLKTCEFKGGFLLKDKGGLLNLLLVCGVAR
jgi:hypothetical protein